AVETEKSRAAAGRRSHALTKDRRAADGLKRGHRTDGGRRHLHRHASPVRDRGTTCSGHTYGDVNQRERRRLCLAGRDRYPQSWRGEAAVIATAATPAAAGERERR